MPERRAFARYQPARLLPCNVNVVLGESSWPAMVADVSTDGVSIISDSWLPAETMLLIELGCQAEAGTRTLLAHVRHATPRPCALFPRARCESVGASGDVLADEPRGLVGCLSAAVEYE